MIEHDASTPALPLVQLGKWAGALLLALRTEGAFAALQTLLGELVVFPNFIVLAYRSGATPELLASSFDRDYLLRHLQDYMRGLYQLDPFYGLADGKTKGLYRMRDIAPEGFEQSEYSLRHYQSTQVIDELRYLVPMPAGRSIHVLIERESPSLPFDGDELAKLEAMVPLVDAFVAQQMEWLDMQNVPSQASRAEFDLRGTIQAIAPGEVTARECDIIELMLKGHSVKSMAGQLLIEDVTVTNHKRNIYAKLGVHSQAQLFDRFLRALTGQPA